MYHNCRLIVLGRNGILGLFLSALNKILFYSVIPKNPFYFLHALIRVLRLVYTNLALNDPFQCCVWRDI